MSRNGAREAACTQLVAALHLYRTVTSGTRIDGGMLREFAVFPGFELSRDDVHNATHRIAAVKQAGRTAQHLYPIGNHRLVGVGNAVAEDALVLRVSVDEHQHLSCTGTEAANIDATRTARAHAVAHHASAGQNDSRHFLHDGRQHAGPFVGQESVAADGVDRHGQMANVCGSATACDDHLIHLRRVTKGFFSMKRESSSANSHKQ